MTDWKKPWDFPLPDPAVNMAEYMLAFEVRSNLQNSANFLSGLMGPQFASPQAYLENMITFAVSLTQNNFAVKYAPPGWNAVSAGFRTAYAAFDFLKQLPVNANDPDSASIFNAWVAKTGALYGGHWIAVSGPAPKGDGVNTATGPNAGGVPAVLGGTGA